MSIDVAGIANSSAFGTSNTYVENVVRPPLLDKGNSIGVPVIAGGLRRYTTDSIFKVVLPYSTKIVE